MYGESKSDIPNPYQCPETVDQTAREFGYLFREGNWLIVRRGDVKLPPLCVFSGSADVGKVRKIQLQARNLSFRLYLEIPTVSLLYYCRPSPEGWYVDATSWFGRGLVGMSVFLVLMMTLEITIGFWLGCLGFLLFLLGTVFFDTVCGHRKRLKVDKSEGDFLWISGVSPLLLDELPDWPLSFDYASC